MSWSWRRAVKLVAASSLILLIWGLNRDAERCEQDCYGTYRTYDPGHAWTNYPDAWQWDAQSAMVGVAFLLGAAAFVFMLADRRRLAVRLAAAAAVLDAGYLLWVILSP